MMRRSLLACAAAAAVAIATASVAAPTNLLFIAVDDLRPEIGGVFGASGMITPGIEKLMGEGTTFMRAYTNVPVCSPSRTSFLTGMRPRDTRVWTIGPYFRQQAHNASAIVTLPQALKNAGFNTTGGGKVWHPGTSSGGSSAPDVGGDDAPMSWTCPPGTATCTPYNTYWECDQFYNGTVQSTASVYWPGGVGCIQSDSCQACLASNGFNASWNSAVSNVPCPDDCFPDGLVANRAIEEMSWKAANPQAQPWALFLGFKRPHLNFFAPSWAYDLYNASDMPLAANRYPSVGMPQDAFFQNGEIAGGHDVHPYMYTWTDSYGQDFKLVQDAYHGQLRAAYRASVSYMDSQLLRVLTALETSGLRNSTWIVFFGDHGWSLGEHGEWAKQNNFEIGTRVPLIIAPPTGPAGSGFGVNTTFEGIVELVDLFPTLLDPAVLGSAVPPGTVPAGQLAGDSLVPVLRAGAGMGRDGQEGAAASMAALLTDPAFTTAFSEISRGTNAAPTSSPPDGSIQGLTVRTRDWRFSAWVPFNYSAPTPGPIWSAWNSTWDVELYDHRNDTGKWDDHSLGMGAGAGRVLTGGGSSAGGATSTPIMSSLTTTTTTSSAATPAAAGPENYDWSENVNLARDPTYAGVVQQLLGVVQAHWPNYA